MTKIKTLAHFIKVDREQFEKELTILDTHDSINEETFIGRDEYINHIDSLIFLLKGDKE